MKFFPDATTFVKFGALQIKWYAVLIMFGAAVAYYFCVRGIKEKKYISVDEFTDLFVYTLWFGVIGARIWYCVFYNLNYYLANPIAILRVFDGGLAIQGGLVGGFLFVYLYCKKHHLDLMVMMDIVLPNVLLGQASGRWGNFINKECHGGEVSEEYFNGILSFLKEGMYINGHYYEPLFFFESTLCLIGWIIIYCFVRKHQNKRGDLSYAYLMWYGVIRFFIEQRRTDSLYIGNFKMAMVTSLVFVVAGILGFVNAFGLFDKRQKPTIIFDMDGTLVNTTPSIIAAYEALFEKFDDINNFTAEKRTEVLGPALKDIFPKYFPGHDYDELYEVYRKRQIEVSPIVNHISENCDTTLATLSKEGYHIAIVSTRHKDGIEELLKDFNLSEYVEAIYGLADVDNLKPAPDAIFKCFAEHPDWNRNDVIMIGDSPMDILCGQNYGAYTIGYLDNPDKSQMLKDAKPNKTVTDLAEILEIVKEKKYFTYNQK